MGELMLSGNWRNFDELEESLSYPEVYIIVQAQRDRDQRNMKFQAALQGVDLDAQNKQPEEDPVEKIKRRLRAQAAGKSEDDIRLSDKLGSMLKITKE